MEIFIGLFCGVPMGALSLICLAIIFLFCGGMVMLFVVMPIIMLGEEAVSEIRNNHK